MADKNKNWSRRDFMKIAGAAGVGAVVSPMAHLAGAVGISESEVSAPRHVPTRPFGMSGVDVSILTLGGKRSRTRFRSATLCAISCITVITEISNRLLGFSMNCRLIHVSALCRSIIRLFFSVNERERGQIFGIDKMI